MGHQLFSTPSGMGHQLFFESKAMGQELFYSMKSILHRSHALIIIDRSLRARHFSHTENRTLDALNFIQGSIPVAKKNI